jgi:serine/threonine protein kinase
MNGAVRFGPYELVRRLGSGGMAETFLAVRRGPGEFEQHVCVKRILPAWEGDPQFVRQFMEEARLAAQLRHANINQVVDFGVASGQHYLALELVDGVDLRSLVKTLRERGIAVDPRIAIFLATELAAALDFAHTPQRGRPAVIHRDVSPSNILVSRAGEVYLIDFGIARGLGTKRHTDSGVVRGKIPYIAAEYATSGTFDARSDLFALGVVLYEILACRRPYEGVTDLDTLQRIQSGVHDSLAALCPAADPRFVAIVEQLLRPSADERFQSARALLEALSTVAPPPTVARALAELVSANAESLAKSVDIALPSQTLSIPGMSAPPPFPSVTTSSADAVTRTSDRPRDSWNSTDPSHVSHHDRAAPLGGVPATRISFTSPAPSIPTTATRLPVPRPASSRALWLLLSFAGLLLFAAAGVGAYFAARAG